MRTKIALKLRLLRDDEVAFGPGKADLLDAIQRTGSISAAARAMEMSYRRAWLLVDVMNRCFREPLVLGAAGGRQGGGASVTEAGLRALKQFRTMEAAAYAAAQPHLNALIKQLRTESDQ